MIIRNTKYGDVYVTVQVKPSAVDSFLMKGHSLLDGTPLTDQQLQELQDTYEDQVQLYAYENGSRNHN